MIKVEMGEQVVIVQSYGRTTTQRGRVVKIARVWIEVWPEGYPPNYTRRFRLDDQTNGSDLGVPRSSM